MSPTSAVKPGLPSSSESHTLKRQLTLRDLTLTQIMTVVGSSWVGVAAGLGRAQAVAWISAMALFYVPMAVSVYFLNREMPLEGGLYVWARRAFGDAGGFMTAWNIWTYGLAITATILFQVPTELAFLLGPSGAWIPENHVAVYSLLGLLLGAMVWSARRGLSLGKWIHNLSGAALLIVFALLIATPAWAWMHHEPIQYAPLAMQMPKHDMVSLALLGQLFGALCGLEYIAIMAGETRDPSRNIGRSVVIASPVICAMFLFGTGAVVAFHEMHPAVAINYIAPIPQTLRLALGSAGGASSVATLAILLLQVRILGAASFIFTGVVRLPMAAGWDHLIPTWFTRLHPRYRTPVNSIGVATVVVACFMVFASLGVKAAEAFQVLNGAASEMYSLAYLAMFLIPMCGVAGLRRRFPRWVAVTSVAGFVATVFCFVLTAYPFVDVVNPVAYAGKILGTTAVANGVGYGFYRWRRGG